MKGDFDWWFDGGAIRSITGNTEYHFTTGARCDIPVTPLFHVYVTLADGTPIHIAEPERPGGERRYGA
jgi:hypothetical protein